MNKAAKNILNNNTSGSEELLDSVIDFLLKVDNEEESQFIATCKDKFVHFETITSFLNQYDTTNPETKKDFLHNFSSMRNNAFYKLSENASKEFGRYTKFVTLSNSKTLLTVLKYLVQQNNNLEVSVSESRPKNEGVLFAEKLAGEGITTTIVTEAQLPDHVDLCDAVIFGVDIILANNDVVNKTGSKLLSILARWYDKPVYVVAQKSKKSKRFNCELDNHPAIEIYEPENPDILISNNYFEIVPSNLITKILTD